MKKKIMMAFFRYSIRGDELELDKLQEKLGLPITLYKKGDIINKYNHNIVQKTNRCVYQKEKSCDSKSSVQAFLTQNIRVLYSKKDLLKEYIKNFTNCLEFIVYADNKTDIILTKTNIKYLSELGLRLTISFN